MAAQEEEDELMQLSHVTTDMRQINSIRWNPADQNEIACGSRRFHNLHIYDCYAPTEPPKIKCKRRADHEIEDWMPGLSDVAFASTNESCIVASDFHYPTVAVWDTRENNGLPVRQLRLNHNGREATCVQYSEYGSDQHVVGGGTGGFVYLWDLPVADIPLQEWSVFDLMEGQHLTVGYNGRDAHNIYSIDFNPVNHGQLAFHLDNGWSGVIDFQSSSISHIHRPLARPALEEVCRDPFCIRRCSWFSNSIYMAPSRNRRGIFLLDFHPSRSSPYHVNSVWNNDDNHRGLIELSEAVITSAAHPFYDMIVAGTENTSLLVISQKAESVKGEQVANPVEQVANVVAEGANGDGEVNDEVEDAEMSDEDEDEEVTDEDEDEDEDE
ncbi:hypothetical protein P8452_19413 [Trifolium repens]|nr:hypothetical protein P8452_19413 [Trifolium repens]